MEFDFPNVVNLAVPGFILAMLIELFIGLRGRARYETRDTVASLIMGTVSVLAGLVGAASIYGLHLWLWDHRLIDGIGADWWVFPLSFALQDMGYYWYHRIAHERRWMWAEHVNHHSSQHYNLSTALRQSWTGLIGLGWVFYLPISLLGIHPAILYLCRGINLIYQFWIHTELIDKLPRWFEAVMNTPSHHRVHHATNARYLDANYAGTLILWDRLFGTFVPENAADPPRYGIVKNLATFNPIKIAFHEWWAIVRDVITVRSLRELAGYTWGPPGWSPDGSRKTSADIKAEWEAIERGDGRADE